MTVVDMFTATRPLTREHWWDAAGVVVGVSLVALYVTGTVEHVDVLVYAGLVALVAHAYVSTEHLKTRPGQVASDEMVVAYRELVATRQWNPSGEKTHEHSNSPERLRRQDRVVA